MPEEGVVVKYYCKKCNKFLPEDQVTGYLHIIWVKEGLYIKEQKHVVIPVEESVK
jgi:hypothetical protein